MTHAQDPRGLPHFPELVPQLARWARDGQESLAWEVIAELQSSGVPTETLLFGLLAEAAERIDAWWKTDECFSFEVTVGICHLRTLALRVVASSLAHGSARSVGRRAAMLAPMGDALSFEPILHECSLELAGWRVDKLEGLGSAMVLDYLQRTAVDAAVCYVNDVRFVSRACRCLSRVHRVSKNPRIRIMATGPGFARPGPLPVDTHLVESPHHLVEHLSRGRNLAS